MERRHWPSIAVHARPAAVLCTGADDMRLDNDAAACGKSALYEPIIDGFLA